MAQLKVYTRSVGMENLGFVFGMAGIAFGLLAWIRVENLEKRLKRLDVIPDDYDSLDNPK